MPSEAVFAPAGPDAATEEGWLLVYFFDRARAKREQAPFEPAALRDLNDIFPDATIVVTRRDPVAVFASFATMMTYAARARCSGA